MAKLVGFLANTFILPSDVWQEVSSASLHLLILESQLGWVDGKVHSVWVFVLGSILPPNPKLISIQPDLGVLGCKQGGQELLAIIASQLICIKTLQ